MGGGQKNEKAQGLEKPYTRHSASESSQDLSSAASISCDLKSKQDSALTTLIESYDRCFEELQYHLISNHEWRLIELKTEYDVMMKGLHTEIAGLRTEVESLKDSLVFAQTEIEEIKEQ